MRTLVCAAVSIASLYAQSNQSAVSGTAQIVTGLPTSPRVLREISLGGAPPALAVSDDGEVLLAAPGDDSVVSYRPGRSPEILLRGGGIAAIDFFPGSRDALVAGAS